MNSFSTFLHASAMVLGMFSQSVMAEHLPMDISPPAMPGSSQCSLTASNTDVDYGRQTRWQMQNAPDGHSGLTPGKRSLSISVVCPYSQTMRISLQGDRAQNGDLRYGDSGVIKLRVKDAQLDGKPVTMLKATQNRVSDGSAESALHLQPGDSFTVTSGDIPLSGRSLTFVADIIPLMTQQAARTNGSTASEGRISLQLVN